MRISSQLSRRSGRRKGLTLIEILVVSVIFAIIATSLFVVFKAGLDSWRRTQGHLEVYQNARAALDMMTRELSAAYLNPADSTITFRGFNSASHSGWVASNGGDEVFFVAALNPSLNYNDAALELCKVGYYLDNTTNQLMKYFYYVKTGKTPDYDFSHYALANDVTFTKIASNVTGLTFQYYDDNSWTATSPAPSTWNSTLSSAPPDQLNKKPTKVEITLTVQDPNSTKPHTFSTGVYIP